MGDTERRETGENREAGDVDAVLAGRTMKVYPNGTYKATPTRILQHHSEQADARVPATN